MKILFVYRGYPPNLSNSVIDFQRNALEQTGLKIDVFPITSGGIKGYLHALRHLRAFIHKNSYCLVHAHYNFSGYIAALASRRPVVCSLMGSDVLHQKIIIQWLTRLFHRFLWQAVIVKSIEMQKKVPGSFCIPNGVDMENFRPMPKISAMRETEFDPSKKHIVFVAQQPDGGVKNLGLARAAINRLGNDAVVLHTLSHIAFKKLPYYYNAADLLLLTSLSEGSPNVIKEAMACNCPIVTTDVGDVQEVIQSTPGCYITSFDPQDVAEGIRKALAFGKRTNGREQIRHLDNAVIARKIVQIYRDVGKRS
jgi:teichuronic acid biosynthesis glycosyltransferase TuaC